MATNGPPQNPIDIAALPYDVMRDAVTGEVIYNRYGHAQSAKLTPEQENQIIELHCEGLTIPAIAKQLRTTVTRVSTHLNKPKVAEKVAYTFVVNKLAARLNQMEQIQAATLEVMKALEARISDIQSWQPRINQAARRQRIGREQVERSNRSKRVEINRLRRALHKTTGRKDW